MTKRLQSLARSSIIALSFVFTGSALGSGICQMSVSAGTKSPCSFEVAAIHPSKGDSYTIQHIEGDGTIYRATSTPLVTMFNQAFAVRDAGRVIGYPKWAEKELFDLLAKTPEGKHCLNSMPGLGEAMLPLLKERFGLRYHTEERAIQTYRLEVMPGRFTLKPTIGASGDPANPPAHFCVIWPPATLRMQNCSMEELAEMIHIVTGHSVTDQTNLKEHYTYRVKFDGFSTPGIPPPGSSGIYPAGEEPGPPLLDAIQELGLRAVPGTTRMPVFVIDHLERPTSN